LKRRQLFVLSKAPKFFFAALALSLVQPGLPGQTPDVIAAREIARADREFSGLSREKGMPLACVQYFANDGVAFAPGPVNGKEYWSAHTSFGGVLLWQPVFSAAAHSLDLGYSTGPWELRNTGASSLRTFGNYVTVWRKQATGDWKVVLDIGTQNPEPDEPPASLEILPADPTAGQRPSEDARTGFRRTYDDFVTQAKEDSGKAVIRHAANEIRVYRDHAAPAIGLLAARILLEPDHAKATLEEPHTRLSKAVDLACIYGSYSEERGNITGRGVYLTIWRIDLNGDWKLVLDLEKQLPPTSQ
jgi:ketosteroid isomerase-like protein